MKRNEMKRIEKEKKIAKRQKPFQSVNCKYLIAYVTPPLTITTFVFLFFYSLLKPIMFSPQNFEEVFSQFRLVYRITCIPFVHSFRYDSARKIRS